ncbi:cytochrome P450 [Mycena alexandri]|uniref:Cytochrome P450 n=1 Tax=Mycena alexandri TaxID=1745969 RepID=A0AAD6XC64_9AGAR|nr:cytochrome P450 [Mycena alexandri]
MSDYLRYTLPYHLSLLSGVVLGLFSLLFVFLFFVSNLKARKEHASVPSSLPWVGTKPELFSAIRANFRGLIDSVNLFTQGYRKYSKADEIYVVPTWTKGPQVILPPSMGQWLSSRPDAILNAKDCTFETAQFTYTVGHPEITSNDMIDLLIKRELTKKTGALNDVILQEIEGSMEGIFGTDGEWREVGVFDSLTRTVGRAANRIFVGKELCSNMDFVMAGTHFARDISVSSYILHLFPKFMKPVVAWFATIPNRRHSGIAMKYLKPLIRQRIADMKQKAADPTYAWEEPNDFITWMVRESFKRNTEDETSVYALAYRVVLLNFAAITTTTIMSTNALLDIWSSPNSEELVAALREEAQHVLHEHNGEWTKAAVAKLHRLDSAIRESARISGVGGTAMARRVRTDDGITLPNGLVVPKNSTVGVSMDGLHFDEAYYDRVNEFDPFRFSRPREEPGYGDKPRANEDLVTTSVHWLPFSHGIHACPGRFFAANNIKMILAQILLNYDIQPFPSRPPNISLGDISVVPVKATMMIRRRNVKA